jgi:hypothetical protein
VSQPTEVRYERSAGQCAADGRNRFAVNGEEIRAQHLVTSPDFVDRLLEGADVQRTPEPNDGRYVVDRSTQDQLLEQPQSLLSERHYRRLVAGHWQQLGIASSTLL